MTQITSKDVKTGEKGEGIEGKRRLVAEAKMTLREDTRRDQERVKWSKWRGKRDVWSWRILWCPRGVWGVERRLIVVCIRRSSWNVTCWYFDVKAEVKRGYQQR